MSSLKTRLVKLESSIITDTEPLRIARFIVDPGNLKPIGYHCDNVKIIREPDESIEALHKRCIDSVEWPDFNYSHIFYPLDLLSCTTLSVNA